MPGHRGEPPVRTLGALRPSGRSIYRTTPRERQEGAPEAISPRSGAVPYLARPPPRRPIGQ